MAAEPEGEKRIFIHPFIAMEQEDYRDQGEYVGSITASSGENIPLAIQVSAEGNGVFRAAMYRGGLPGSGWDGEVKSLLYGSRSSSVDGSILLTSAQHSGSFHLAHGVGEVRNHKGQTIGKVEKVIRRSPTENLIPPDEAKVLFGGSGLGGLKNAAVTEEGLLEVGFMTEEPVTDFRLHLEFRTPFMPHARGQGRGNSGVYIQQRYETQILDSFSLEGAFNECGALYRQRTPDLNMAFPPLTWQTYDLFFLAARFDSEGKKTDNARISLFHNGVAVHDDVEIIAKTGAGQQESPEPRPILFQNHRDPVRFRNLWIIPTTEAASRQFVPHSGPIVTPLVAEPKPVAPATLDLPIAEPDEEAR